MDESSPPAGSLPPAFQRRLPLAILIALPCLLVAWRIGPRSMPFGMDMVGGSYYIRALVGQELAQGHLASWDPYSMCGFPLMAALQSGVFYPLTWPDVLLGPGLFWTLTVMGHLILSGLFAYFWLHRGLALTRWGAFVGACVFMLSGYFLSHVYGGHISQISAYPWMAALLWRTERLLHRPTLKRWTLLAASIALLTLPGFPQFLFFGFLLLGLRLLLHVARGPGERPDRLKRATLGLAAAGLGLLLASPQLLPTMELIPKTQRTSINTYDFATSFSFPPENLLTLVAPGFFGADREIPYWGRSALTESCGFVGIGTFLLAALALGRRHPQGRFWAGIALAALVLALGRHTPVFKLFYYGVPGASLFRAPGRYLSLFTLALAALSAIGFDRWWKGEEDLRRACRNLGIGAAALLAIILVVLMADSSALWQDVVEAQKSASGGMLAGLHHKYPRLLDTARGEAGRSLGRAALTLGLCSALFLAQWRGRLPGRLGPSLLAGVVVVELLGFGAGFLEPLDEATLGWPPRFAEFAKGLPGGPYRIASTGFDNSSHVGKCQKAGLDHVGGYEAMLLRRYAELMNTAAKLPPDTPTVTTGISSPHPILEMLGVKIWLAQPPFHAPAGWARLPAIEGCDVVLSPNAFPRAFLARRAVTIPDRDERLKYLGGPGLDFRQVVVVESPEPDRGLPDAVELGSAQVTSFGPGRYEIAADTPGGAYLVLTESHYPGWEASSDGAPLPILQANHLVQAVWLTPGKHVVRFDYHSRWLGFGFLLAGLAACVPVGLHRWGRRR